MLAKIATTVDIVSDGRLDFGIGAGSRPSLPLARREYDAHGLPFHDTADFDDLNELLVGMIRGAQQVAVRNHRARRRSRRCRATASRPHWPATPPP